MPLPDSQTAIIADSLGNLAVAHGVPLPEVEPDMLLVRTVAVAVNPVDVKLTGAMAVEGAVAGSDCSGVVVAVGSAVPPSKFAVGDRVCAAITPMNPATPRIGAFAEYVGATADCALRLPDGISFDSGATLSIGVATIGYALFQSLKVPGHPDSPATTPQYILVYGGSTASGTLAIQLARKAGLIPITTCSPKNFALVESRGAEKAFDYHDPSSAADIRAYTKNALDSALDCHCDASSMQYCYAAIGRAGGRYTTLEPYPEQLHTRKRIKPDWILGPALLGKNVNWKAPYTIKARPELRLFARDWFMCAQRLLNNGDLEPHPARVGEKVGFGAILEGVDILRKGTVSGEKLVYHIKDGGESSSASSN
ncbi:chaperonin 10-like protein [Chaetomium tenue]|uniref:Chaperonin 10-like protein n=1 Tax=Chaetomium tenue TaxID=1854479 RepID=A0ACB7P362_9PEZI|nr:chaperonin 10-like protein [Chaetomium globosum]